MQTFFLKNPRLFSPRPGSNFEISDQGKVQLEPDEQITFVTESGAESDICRKDWGFYPVPSLNSRLLRFNLRPVLVRNPKDHFFLLLVESEHQALFEQYVSEEQLTVIGWFDDATFLSHLSRIAEDENK